jgi:hypothetical protein
VVCLALLPAPLIVIVKMPIGAVDAAVNVSDDEPPVVTEDGLKLAVTPGAG